MESIKKFRNIVLAIIISIFILFIFNLFWLKGLYASIESETAQTIYSCIEDADNAEMQKRLELISLSPDFSGFISIDKSISSSDTTSAYNTLKTTTQHTVNKSYTVVTNSESLGLDLDAFSQLIKEVRLTMHQSLDSVVPINLLVLDSLINIKLTHSGLSAVVYYSEIVDLETNAILKSSINSKSLGKPGHLYQYIYDTENNFAYNVYASSVSGTILTRMSGILVTTFLIILILIFAFIYFIRTVMKLKTLEEMKTDFINNMTHELKTPLAAAYSAVDTLINFKQGDDKQKSDTYIQLCEEQLSHLNGLVEQILSISMRKEKSIVINKEIIKLPDLINQLVQQHKLKTNKQKNDFNIELTPKDLTVKADRLHLSNIISNIIDNAIKYSSDSVRIDIKCYLEKGRYCVISIKDYGIGITKENQERIFDKFFRVPNGNIHNVKGYGLGLFYVKTMIEKHNGTILVDSNLGEGSVFIIKLPV